LKKVVILGVNGMAGHVIARYLKKTNNYQIFGVAREDGIEVDKILDVLDSIKLKEYIQQLKPDIVINCVGMLVAKSNEDVVNAINTNALLPHTISKLGNELDFKLIHLSTDCVFSGRDGGYNEESAKDGLDNYAKTKALGEIINNKDLTIRTSIIGPELKNGTGLLNWFLQQENKIFGYTHAYWSGVTTLELAKAIDEMIKQQITGLYHLCPQNKISKYELLRLFAKVYNKSITIEPFDDYTIDKSLICTRDDFKYHVLDYETMLYELKEWMDEYKEVYNLI
jgi:dTDP-4-dehydrorhamnose reductase